MEGKDSKQPKKLFPKNDFGIVNINSALNIYESKAIFNN